MTNPLDSAAKVLRSIMDESEPIQARTKAKIQKTLQDKLGDLGLIHRTEFDTQVKRLDVMEEKIKSLECLLKELKAKDSSQTN